MSNVFLRVPAKAYPTAVRGDGVWLYDDQGNRFLDGSGGACVVGIGHGVREVRDAVASQMDRLSCVHASHFITEATEELAGRVAELCGGVLERVFFHDISNLLGGLVGLGEILKGSVPQAVADDILGISRALTMEIKTHRLLLEAEQQRLVVRQSTFSVTEILDDLKRAFAFSLVGQFIHGLQFFGRCLSHDSCPPIRCQR